MAKLPFSEDRAAPAKPGVPLCCRTKGNLKWIALDEERFIGTCRSCGRKHYIARPLLMPVVDIPKEAVKFAIALQKGEISINEFREAMNSLETKQAKPRKFRKWLKINYIAGSLIVAFVIWILLRSC